MVEFMVFFKDGPLAGKIARIKLAKVPSINGLLNVGLVEGLYRIHDTPVNTVALKLLSEGKEPTSLAVTVYYEEPETISETSA